MRKEVLKLLTIDIDDERYTAQAPEWQTNGFEIVRVKDMQAGIEAITAAKDLFSIIGINADGLPYFPLLPIMRGVIMCPINVITSNYSIENHAQSLYYGADHYSLWKSPKESVVLAKAMIHRSLERAKSKQPIKFLSYQNVFVCLTSRKVYINGEETEHFTRKEFELICLLMSDCDRVFTYSQILRQVWRDEYVDKDNAMIWSMIKRIRSKMKNLENVPYFIYNVKDVGYVFDTK